MVLHHSHSGISTAQSLPFTGEKLLGGSKSRNTLAYSNSRVYGLIATKLHRKVPYSMGLKKILTKSLWLEVPAQNGGWKQASPKTEQKNAFRHPKDTMLAFYGLLADRHETWHEATLYKDIDKKVTKNTVTRNARPEQVLKTSTLKNRLKTHCFFPQKS